MSDLKGKILISQPFMLDPHFKRTVVFVCEHNEEGSYGFILNRPVELSGENLFDFMSETDFNFSYGGPVATDTLHYIHDMGEIVNNSIEVVPGIWSDGDFEQVKELIDSEAMGQSNILFFVGYSGWSEGQLEEELKAGSWIVSEITIDKLLRSNDDALWKEVLKDLGHSYQIIAEIPDSANYN